MEVKFQTIAGKEYEKSVNVVDTKLDYFFM